MTLMGLKEASAAGKSVEMARCNSNSTGHVTVDACQKRINSDTLLGDAGRIVIEHEGAEYVLRVTSQKKLILTK